MKNKRILPMVLAITLLSSSNVFADQVIKNNKNYAMLNSGVTVNALGETIYPTLTLDEAVKKAIDYSPTIKNLKETETEADNSFDDVTFSFRFATDADIASTTSNQQVAYSIRALSNSLRTLSANQKIAEDAVRLNIESLFNSIKTAQDDIELHEKNMVIQEKQIKIAEVKKNLGLMSQLEYDNTVNTYNTTVAEIQTLENSVESAFRALNEAMGTDLSYKYEIVLDDIEFTPIGSVNLSASLSRAVASAESIKSKKDAVELAEYDYKTYVPSTTDTGLHDKKLNAVSQARRDLETTETNLRSNMTTIYENITDAEQTYTDTVGTINVLKSQYEVIKTQYELGKATELDVLTTEYNIAKAEAGLDKLVRGHKLLVDQFNNPDLIQAS